MSFVQVALNKNKNKNKNKNTGLQMHLLRQILPLVSMMSLQGYSTCSCFKSTKKIEQS
jgi:hypothetical protein